MIFGTTFVQFRPYEPITMLETPMSDLSAEPTHIEAQTPSPAAETPRPQRHGQYIVAPDSAEPLPDAIWQRIDLDVLDSSIARAAEALAAATPKERAELTAASGIFVPRAARDILEQIGGPEMQEALDRLKPAS